MLENENLNEAENPQLNIGAVMPSFIQEVEKEAYLMIKKYGKEYAEKTAIGYANDLIKDINALPYYDKDKVSSIDSKKWYWLTVASAIKNWA
jgi:hypothetical protein